MRDWTFKPNISNGYASVLPLTWDEWQETEKKKEEIKKKIPVFGFGIAPTEDKDV